MIQVYYGYGKGKTSALNGAAMRANFGEFDVKMYRFLKGKVSKEDKHLEAMGVPVYLAHPKEENSKFVFQMNEEEKNVAKQEALKGMQEILKNAKPTDVILMDEFIDLSVKGVEFLTEKETVDFLKELNTKVAEIIVTGHRMFDSLAELADLITEFKKEKHYYDKGVKARNGFEH